MVNVYRPLLESEWGYCLEVDHVKEGVFKLLRAMYRHALQHLGYSPDAHVYDLRDGELARKLGASSLFLRLILHRYNSLDKEAQRYFLIEVLEKGRHYRFWWLAYYTPDEYRKYRKAWALRCLL